LQITDIDMVEKYQKFLKMDKKIIVLVMFGRTGSTFIHGLLDNRDTNLNYVTMILPPLIDRFYKAENRVLTLDEIEYIVSPMWKFLGEFYDIEEFKSIFFTIAKTLELNGVMLFKLLYFTIGVMNKQDLEKIEYLINHQHMIDNNHSVEAFYREFKDVKYIFAMKDSRSQVKSIFRHLSEIDKSTDYYYDALYNYTRALDFYNQNIKKSYTVINEKLNLSPESEVKKLIEWLGLEFSSNYMDCTNQGEHWGAYKSNKVSLKGNEFSKLHIESFNDIDRKTIKYIELVQGNLLLSFGYKLKFIKTKMDYLKHIHYFLSDILKNSESNTKKLKSSSFKNIYVRALLFKQSIKFFKKLEW